MPDAIKKLIWPLAALVLLLAYNALANPTFFNLEKIDGRWSGSIVDVFRNGSPVMLTALGMTLVIATGGVDLSVGALMAVAGSLATWLIVGCGVPAPVALVIALCACGIAGLWNGTLVAFVRIQPIVATLILMMAGRGIAQMIDNGQNVSIKAYPAFVFLGRGAVAGIPVPVWIAGLLAVAVAVLVRWTALGLFVEAIGGSETASRYAGLSVRLIRLLVYVVSGLCAGTAGLIYTANIAVADANRAGLDMELNAILAVVVGGTALAGGRFTLLGSLLGALIIQTLDTTVLAKVSPDYIKIVKALVVLAVCLLQSERTRKWFVRRKGAV
jgi:simple sugar transport system permease protein